MRPAILAAVATLALSISACGSDATQIDAGKAKAAATQFACPSRDAVTAAVGRSVPKPKRTMQASLTLICSYAGVDAGPEAPILIVAITFGTTAGQLSGIAHAVSDGPVRPFSGVGQIAFQSHSDGQQQIFVEGQGRSVSCPFGDEDHLTTAQKVSLLKLFL